MPPPLIAAGAEISPAYNCVDLWSTTVAAGLIDYINSIVLTPGVNTIQVDVISARLCSPWRSSRLRRLIAKSRTSCGGLVLWPPVGPQCRHSCVRYRRTQAAGSGDTAVMAVPHGSMHLADRHALHDGE